MEAYRADRVVRVLSGIVTVLYWMSWAGLVLTVVALPALRFGFADNPEWTFNVPVEYEAGAGEIVSGWGGQEWPLELVDTHTDLHVPLAAPPFGFFASLWVTWVGGALLLLAAMYHLRRIFRRVREGAPFDPENARLLRMVGLLLLGYALLEGVSSSVFSAIVLRTLTVGGAHMSSPLSVNGSVVLMSLVLIALAEIFRRGAALEDEQALVV